MYEVCCRPVYQASSNSMVLSVLRVMGESVREAPQKRGIGLRWPAATANVSHPVGCVKLRILDVVLGMSQLRRSGRIVTVVCQILAKSCGNLQTDATSVLKVDMTYKKTGLGYWGGQSRSKVGCVGVVEKGASLQDCGQTTERADGVRRVRVMRCRQLNCSGVCRRESRWGSGTGRRGVGWWDRLRRRSR